jgi:RNA polymerase primary sigma factor
MLDQDQAGAPEDVPSEDSLRIYLRQISRYPLLTRTQEIELARRAATGDAAARRRLIESNLRLVVTIARSFRAGSLDLLDLIQEGTLGLMRAVELYDWRRGTKLSTYSAWWIRHAILEAIVRRGQTIRIPDAVRGRIAEINHVERSLSASLGRSASTAEIADSLGLSVGQVLDARAASQPISSLDASVDEADELRLGDVLADPSAPDPLQAMIDETPPIDIDAELSRLTERSRQVIELRYGLRDGVERTGAAVAAELGIARERVRYLELHSLRKLAPMRAKRAA